MTDSYEQIVNSLFEGVYILDKQRKILFWNHGAEDITGFMADEVVGKYCHDNILNHVDDNGKQLCLEGCPLYQTLIDGKKREMNVYLQHKKGHRIPVLVKALALYEDENIVAVAEIFSQVDEKALANPDLSKIIHRPMSDELTGLPNRGHLEHFLNNKLHDLKLLGIDTGLIIVDIDNFEESNDTYGKELCDEIMKILSVTYVKNFRVAEMIGRWTEDEFIFIFEDINEKDLKVFSEKIRMISESTSLRGATFKDVEVTVSTGATMARVSDTIDDLLERAYNLMHLSKQKGGNAVTI